MFGRAAKALAEELAFNQTLGWALSVISNSTNATTVEDWLVEIVAVEGGGGADGFNASAAYNASAYCAPYYENASSTEQSTHMHFDPMRCLDAMGVNATTLQKEGAHAVMAINDTIWPSRDWCAPTATGTCDAAGPDAIAS